MGFSVVFGDKFWRLVLTIFRRSLIAFVLTLFILYIPVKNLFIRTTIVVSAMTLFSLVEDSLLRRVKRFLYFVLWRGFLPKHAKLFVADDAERIGLFFSILRQLRAFMKAQQLKKDHDSFSQAPRSLMRFREWVVLEVRLAKEERGAALAITVREHNQNPRIITYIISHTGACEYFDNDDSLGVTKSGEMLKSLVHLLSCVTAQSIYRVLTSRESEVKDILKSCLPQFSEDNSHNVVIFIKERQIEEVDDFSTLVFRAPRIVLCVTSFPGEHRRTTIFLAFDCYSIGDGVFGVYACEPNDETGAFVRTDRFPFVVREERPVVCINDKGVVVSRDFSSPVPIMCEARGYFSYPHSDVCKDRMEG